MKLAEALILRADMQKCVAQYKNRINDNAKVQEGDKPAEQPTLLFLELNDLLPELQALVVKINMTNTRTMIDGKTMTELLAEKEVLGTKLDIYRSAYSNAIIRSDRYSRNEIRFVSAIDIESLQKKIDTMSKRYRELDTIIQQANWTNDLIED